MRERQNKKKNIVITVNSTHVLSLERVIENREEIKDGSRLRIGEE